MNALNRLREWIAAPFQGDDHDIPVAASVQWVAIVYAATGLVALVAIQLAFAQPGWRIDTALGCLALLGLTLWLTRRKHVRAGAALLVATTWLPLVFAVAMTDGVSLSAQSGFVLAICSAGLLLGRRAAFAVAGLSALVGPIFGGLHLRSDLPSASAGTFSWGLWLMQAGIFASTAALVSITLGYAQRSLERAQRSERRFRALADNIQDVIIEYDAQDRFVYANPVFLRRRGMTRLEQLADKRIGYTIHPDDLERVTEQIRSARDTATSASFSTKIATEQGGVAIVDATAGGFIDADGERRVVLVSRDVTEQRSVEDALRDSEERYRMLAEHAPDMIVEHDATGRIVYANYAAREHGYWPSGGVVGSFGDWNHPDDIEACRNAFEDAMRTGQVQRLVHRMRKKDGSYHWVSSSGAPYRTSRGEMRMVGQSRDISEEIALQEQLRQAQKMEAIGRLAGGVAHDFNNLLTVIAGYAELLEDPQQAGADTVLAAREIGAAAERAAGLTRQLLALSRRQLAKPLTVDLNEVVRGLEPVLRRTLPESIQIEFVLDPELPPVQADPSQLDQVLLNLALNARDAMPSRGRLQIETRAGEACRSLHLLVSDSGVGMDEETRLRAFEPFFTTKPSGEGSGLGLSTTYGIVQQCGGSIALDSAPGCGTRVAIELPAASVAATQRQPPPGAARHVAPHAAAILLVEDDPSVRRLLTLMLQSSGYIVHTAASGDEALELSQRPEVVVDLLLTDYVLPGISGVELCVALRERWPDLRLLVMTGHAEIPPAGAAELPEGAELLGKPFTREQLSQLLARQLASA
jgi:two-component system cell cycle sensor histidine kinase/response regulator CckA